MNPTDKPFDSLGHRLFAKHQDLIALDHDRESIDIKWNALPGTTRARWRIAMWELDKEIKDES